MRMVVTAAATQAYVQRLRVLRNSSEHTLRAYTYDLRDYARFLGAESRRSDQGDSILAYADHLMTRAAAPRTVRRRMACLRGFYRNLVREGTIPRSPFSDLEMQLPRAQSLPRGLTRSEASLLTTAAWSACEKRGDAPTPVAFPIALLVMTSVGLRVGELVEVQSADFAEGSGALRVHGKGRRERLVFLVDADLRQLVTRQAESRQGLPLFGVGTEGWTTQHVRRSLSAFATDAGIVRRITPHMLRHTCATLLLEDGVDLRFLQRLLGHESISTTAIYAHVGDIALKSALETAGLLSRLRAGSPDAR